MPRNGTRVSVGKPKFFAPKLVVDTQLNTARPGIWPLTGDVLKPRLMKLSLQKLNALVPGDDATARADKVAIMRECFGVTGPKSFEALEMPALRQGWERIKAWQRDVPPPDAEPVDGAGEAEAPAATDEAEAAEALGEVEDDAPDPTDAPPEEDDEAVTVALLQRLREEAAKRGQVRDLEDFITGHIEAPEPFVLDQEGRAQLLALLHEELPDLAETLGREG
jgi:hypothetical protein